MIINKKIVLGLGFFLIFSFILPINADIRPEKEFHAGHLPNAINVPPNELLQRISNIESDKDIVAYCRGPYCLFSYNAVEALREKGFKAQRLEDGFPEWKAAGYPVQHT